MTPIDADGRRQTPMNLHCLSVSPVCVGVKNEALQFTNQHLRESRTAARIFREVLGTDEARADSRHLRLKLDQLWNEQVELQAGERPTDAGSSLAVECLRLPIPDPSPCDIRGSGICSLPEDS